MLRGSIRAKGKLVGKIGTGIFIPDEVDPTVPSWVKEITQEDIDRWDSGAGVDLSNFYTKEEIENKGYLTRDDVAYISPISNETIEEIVNGSYKPDQNDTTSDLDKAILGIMILR